jgi:hypothetical protein
MRSYGRDPCACVAYVANGVRRFARDVGVTTLSRSRGQGCSVSPSLRFCARIVSCARVRPNSHVTSPAARLERIRLSGSSVWVRPPLWRAARGGRAPTRDDALVGARSTPLGRSWRCRCTVAVRGAGACLRLCLPSTWVASGDGALSRAIERSHSDAGRCVWQSSKDPRGRTTRRRATCYRAPGALGIWLRPGCEVGTETLLVARVAVP